MRIFKIPIVTLYETLLILKKVFQFLNKVLWELQLQVLKDTRKEC